MSDLGDIKMLRDTIRDLAEAVKTLGGVAAREHSSFEKTKKLALDKAYAALRRTNHYEAPATTSSASDQK